VPFCTWRRKEAIIPTGRGRKCLSLPAFLVREKIEKIFAFQKDKGEKLRIR
jgi:hypothetical protein